jgi:plastocyanin
VTFTFQQKNHTVTQSSFASPCTPLEGGFDSGFQFVAADVINGPFPAASLVIEDTDPVWIYCRQRVPTSHCAAGMVFAINPGDGQLAAFQAAAKATGSSSNATATTASSSADATSTAPTTSSASASTTPTDYKVLVGDGGSLSYSPANLTVSVGDTITFEFRAKNHTISQSSFAAPCRLLAATSGTSGFDSSLYVSLIFPFI